MPPSTREFAIRLSSIDELFWEYDARPVAERTLAADLGWSLLDEWERLRNAEPSHLTIYAPQSDRARTDEDALRNAIRTSLRKSSGPLRRIVPLSRQEKVAANIGIAVLLICVMVSTTMSQASNNVVVEGLSQASSWSAGSRSGSRPHASAAGAAGRSAPGSVRPFQARGRLPACVPLVAGQVCAITSTMVMAASATPPTVNSPTVRNRSGTWPPVSSACSKSR